MNSHITQRMYDRLTQIDTLPTYELKEMIAAFHHECQIMYISGNVDAEAQHRLIVDQIDHVLGERDMKKIIKDDEDCSVCDCRAARATCAKCGVSAMITNCGHKEQPRPIAQDEHGDILCDDCA